MELKIGDIVTTQCPIKVICNRECVGNCKHTQFHSLSRGKILWLTTNHLVAVDWVEGEPLGNPIVGYEKTNVRFLWERLLKLL